MRKAATKVHVTVRRTSDASPYRLWAEVDGDFGVVLARSATMRGLRRNASRAIREQWKMGALAEGSHRLGRDTPPRIVWHRSTGSYARRAGRELSEIRKRWRESERTALRVERGLRRAGAYAREARFIARGQAYVELDFARTRRTGRFVDAAWSG